MEGGMSQALMLSRADKSTPIAIPVAILQWANASHITSMSNKWTQAWTMYACSSD